MSSLLQALEQKLSEAVGEAKAFAAQQQADADRTKRSYSQVRALHCPPVVAGSAVQADRSTLSCISSAVAECMAVWFSIQYRAILVQANLRAGDSDVEMKRMRESEDDSEVNVTSHHRPFVCDGGTLHQEYRHPSHTGWLFIDGLNVKPASLLSWEDGMSRVFPLLIVYAVL